MASKTQRLATNVAGDFFVDSTCIDCDTCRWLAPRTFDRSGEQSRVWRQPETPEEVRACADAGAAFAVSPSFSPEMVEAALEAGIEPIPGILTPTELLSARRAGAEAVKVFPAAPVGGPAFIRALRGPFPHVPLLPTGGIGLTDVEALLDAGATCVGLGATLVGAEPPSSADLDVIRERAAAVMETAAT